MDMTVADMTVADVAKMLQISQKTIYRWLGKGKIPAYKLNDQYRFNREELLQWVVAQKLTAPDELLDEAPETAEPPSLSAAVERGGIFYRLGGANRQEVLREITELLKLPGDTNREQLFQLLEARERLGSTGIGNGIALPHSRQALIPGLRGSSVTICFLDQPIPYGALDGQPVQTLFTLISANLSEHVGLLSRIVFALRDEAFRAALARQASKDELHGHIRRLDVSATNRPDRP